MYFEIEMNFILFVNLLLSQQEQSSFRIFIECKIFICLTHTKIEQQ